MKALLSVNIIKVIKSRMRWVSHKRFAQVTKKSPTGCEKELGLLEQLK
jgi:hypothetical protein